jgi:hypothetical protein
VQLFDLTHLLGLLGAEIYDSVAPTKMHTFWTALKAAALVFNNETHNAPETSRRTKTDQLDREKTITQN